MSEPQANPFPSKGQAGADPYSIPLEKIDVSDAELFETDTLWGYFERLRKEDPVHYCAESEFGPYWSVTKFDDIVQVEKHPEIYSSEPTIVIQDPDPEFPLAPGFIAMDGARHTAHRKTVQPVASPRNLTRLEPLIRTRVGEILDGLPVGETFDWVDRVSIELTTGMLATMFDFPWEERRKLTFWSDMATMGDEQLAEIGKTSEEREAVLRECLDYFTTLWKQRENRPQTGELDFVSALANSEKTRDVSPDVSPMEYLGTLILLIVGGNDTTRNSISGGVLALNENPAEYDKAARRPEPHSEHGRRDDPLADAAGPHAPHRHPGHRARRQAHQEGRPDRHVVRLGQSRRDGHPPRERVPDRPPEREAAPVLRLGRSLLHGQPARRDAAAGALGGDHAALPLRRGGGRAGAREVPVCEGLRRAAGAGAPPLVKEITRINHVGIRVRDLAATRAFYEKLGFEFLGGPFGPEPVAIMEHPTGINLNLILNAAGDGAPVNVLQDVPEKHAGITHIALEISDRAAVEEHLEREGIAITETVELPDGTVFFFVRDPDGNVIELHRPRPA